MKNTTPAIEHAVVLGAGTMGAGIAMVFAAAGWRVTVLDPSANARAALPRTMRDSMARLGQVLRPELVTALADLESVDWDGVSIALESATENLPLKQKCFAQLVERAPDDIPLATNSTGYSIDVIAQGLTTRERMLGLHFLMPAQFVPLVEIIPDQTTAPELVERVTHLLRSLGKHPVLIRKPLIGFLANRMQAALMREALSLIDRGLATPEDVDAAVRFSFGFRYAAAGPILQKEHSGWDISYGLYEKVFPDLCNDATPPARLREMIEHGWFGMKSGQGFFSWDPASIAAETQRYEGALRATMPVLKL